MERPIRITADPMDAERCRFVVSESLGADGVRRFASAGEAQGSPLAEAIFAVPGVSELIVSGSVVTVTKAGPAPWAETGRQIGAAIRATMAAAGSRPLLAAGPGVPAAVDDDTLFEKVAQLFNTRINPTVAQHGGRVELIDVQDAVVLLRLGGGCQGCGMATMTLRQGIEATLRDALPEIRGIVDVTDHAAGANPYFAASKS